MMESVTGRLYDALEAAHKELKSLGLQRPHFAAFCGSLASFVVTGKGLPNGVPTEDARKITAEAVIAGMKKTFGEDYEDSQDDAVRAVMRRLASL